MGAEFPVCLAISVGRPGGQDKVLGIAYRTLATHQVMKAGYTRRTAHSDKLKYGRLASNLDLDGHKVPEHRWFD